MTIRDNSISAKYSKVVVAAILLFTTVGVPSTSAAPLAVGTDTCGAVGQATDSANSSSEGSNVQPFDQPSPVGNVNQSGAQSDYQHDGLKLLSAHTKLLEHSDSAKPVIEGGTLDAGCGVSFQFKGTPISVGATGIVGAKIDENSSWLVQSLEGERGYRMMVTLKNTQASTSYTVKWNLENNLRLHLLDAGRAVITNQHDMVVGSILEPWALDAAGNAVPITQEISSKSIKITVDTSKVTNWPVVADPEYQKFRCTKRGQTTRKATARQYLSGQYCPYYSDMGPYNYFPEWIIHFGRKRVGDPNGACNLIPERLDTWRPKDLVSVLTAIAVTYTRAFTPGVIYDYHQACQGHDYCYDLQQDDRLNYPNVSKQECDKIMLDDMRFDCTHRRNTRLCTTIAWGAYIAVATHKLLPPLPPLSF
ncbi:MAG: hypothetical protein OXE04_04625 [bacterium]|nr:hypothetical protein [bacterium]